MNPNVRAAKNVGLHYVTDSEAGIKRARKGGRFCYIGPSGKRVRQPSTLRRIHGLVIPPAWNSVWISSDASGHIQATGRDAKGRKQYLYHTHWQEVRNASKYDQLPAFVDALPAIRNTVRRHLKLPGLQREKVLAAVVQLLESTFIRVGNQRYADGNGSYGLTTLRDTHVKVRGQDIVFDFRGKSGRHHKIAYADSRLATIVRKCQDLPGHHLFQYRDDEGAHKAITSTDVNNYLAQICNGNDFTAKHFRTWAGTMLAALALSAFEPPTSPTQEKKNVAEAIKWVAQRLGNTPSVCRKCYVHPAVIKAYVDGKLASAMRFTPTEVNTLRLKRASEIRLARLLKRESTK